LAESVAGGEGTDVAVFVGVVLAVGGLAGGGVVGTAALLQVFGPRDVLLDLGAALGLLALAFLLVEEFLADTGLGLGGRLGALTGDVLTHFRDRDGGEVGRDGPVLLLVPRQQTVDVG